MVVYYLGEGKWQASFDDVKTKLTALAVDATDGAFFVKDAGGSEVHVYAEGENPNTTSCWNSRLPPKMLGWRVIMFNCPTGYIDVFLKGK